MKTEKKFRTPLWWGIASLGIAWAATAHAAGPNADLMSVVDAWCQSPANAKQCLSGEIRYYNPQDHSLTVGFGAQGVKDMILAFGNGNNGEHSSGGGVDVGGAVGRWLGSDPFNCGGCQMGNPVGMNPAGFAPGAPGINSPGNGGSLGTGGGTGGAPGNGFGQGSAGTMDGGSPNPGADY